MKLLNRSIIAVLLVTILGLNFSYANGDKTPANFSEVERVEDADIAYSLYSVVNASKIKFAFEKATTGNVTIKIYDEDLNLIFTDKRNDAQSEKISYDLSAFGQGTYSVKVLSGKFIKNHTFKVGYSSAPDFNAYISSKVIDEKVRVNFQNASAPVGITISDLDGTVYFDQVITNKSEASQLLNLSQLPKGDYEIEVSSNGKNNTQTVTLN